MAHARSSWVCAGALLFLSACAGTGFHETEHARGDIDLSKPWPSGTPSPYGMAFGGDVKIREHLPRGSSDLDAYLKPEYAAATKAAPSKPVTRHAPIAARPSAPIVTPTLASEPAPEATPVLLAAATPAPQAADPSSDAQRYAEREPAAQKQQEFRGGDAIVIGAGTLILILLVVILILLLR